MKVRYGTGDNSISGRPYDWAEGKMDIHVRTGQYAYTKDGRTIIIDVVIEASKRYRGRDINIKGLPEGELNYLDINSVVDEVCKAVTVD